MAVSISGQDRLLIFRARLDMSQPDIQVACDLEIDDKGEQTQIAAWTYTAAELGIPDRLDRNRVLYEGYPFRLPDSLVNGLREALQRDGVGKGPLWLHLVTPRGYLPLVPWEKLLQPSLGVPILRLPEVVTEPPKESPPWLLEVALCGSMPAAKESFRLPEHLHRIAQRYVEIPARTVTVHIFTDSERAPEVRQSVNNDPLLRDRVIVHDPAGAAAYVVPEATTRISNVTRNLENPWLLWMSDALRQRRVDVMHFISHGYLAQERGALALAESPLQNIDRRISRFAGSAELLVFLTHIGAWTTVFSSPEQNYSEMGLRLLADTIAQRQPGVVVHHDLPLDQEYSVLADALQFLFSTSAPPVTPALFTYCHPTRVPSRERILSPTGTQASLLPDTRYWQKGSTPRWMASAERFMEQSRLEIEKRAQSVRTLRATSGTRSAAALQQEIDEDKKTLQKIHEIIASAASSSQSEVSDEQAHSSGN